MKHLVLFNYQRFLKSKILISVTSGVMLALIILDLVWVNSNKELYLHWVRYGLLILFIGFANIFGLTMIMIDDVNNGIVSLEVRKGISYHWLLLSKLGVYKSITWVSLGISMVLFYLVIQAAPSHRYDLFEKGHLLGYGAMFALDIFLTGIGLLLGSLMKLKILAGAMGFICGLLAFSPMIGGIHLIPLKNGPPSSSDANEYPLLLIQNRAKSNPKGIINFLYNELGFYNNKNIITISKKPNIAEEDINNGLSYEKVDELVNQNAALLSYLLIGSGQPLMLATELNKSTVVNKVANFEFTKEYLNSNIYKFIKATYYDESPNYRDHDLNVGLVNDSTELQTLSRGSKLLHSYINYLKTKAVNDKLINEFGFVNLNEELDIIENILNLIIWNTLSTVDSNGHCDKNIMDFGRKSPIYKDLNNKNTVCSLFTESFFYERHKSENWLYSGNQVFIKFLFNVIATTSVLKPNTGVDLIPESAYEMIYENHSDRNLIYFYNPFVSIAYITLFSGNVKDPLLNNKLMNVFMPGNKDVQDVIKNRNKNFKESSDVFRKVDELPIGENGVTGLVVSPWIFYLPYLIFGITFASIANFIYQRKIRP